MNISNIGTLVMIGDSITDAGRDPSGERTPWPNTQGHGRGYVNMIHALWTARYPEETPRILNRGISGNTVRDLKQRWQTDVLDLQPTWLSVMIGINDVWRQFDLPEKSERHVPLDEYRQTLEDLLTQTRPGLDGLVLMTPYVIEPNPKDPMRARMDEYGQAVRKLAETFDAMFVDTQAAMDRLCQTRHPTAIAWDRIHPDAAGHMALALAWLDAVGLDLGPRP